jgi:uncharacterized membrane protein YbhN (UPF0104 family)
MTPGLEQHGLALALTLLDLLVRALRLRSLVPITLGRSIIVNAYGDGAALITPARVGGDPARYLGLIRSGIEPPRVLSALGVEAVVDWVFVGLVAVALGLVFGGTSAEFIGRLVALLRSPRAKWLLTLLAVAAGAGFVGLPLLWKRLPHVVTKALKDSVRHARELPPDTLAMLSLLTVISIGARTAILPVLAWRLPHVTTGGVLLGSFALIYGQQIIPVPAGAGGVELGFLAGFSGSVSETDLTTLLLAWRFYTVFLGAALGALFLLTRAGSRAFGSKAGT